MEADRSPFPCDECSRTTSGRCWRHGQIVFTERAAGAPPAPTRFSGDLPRTEAGRNYVAEFPEQTGRWAAAVNLVVAIEDQVAAAEQPAPPLDVERLDDAALMSLASMVRHQLGVRGLIGSTTLSFGSTPSRSEPPSDFGMQEVAPETKPHQAWCYLPKDHPGLCEGDQ